MKTYDQPFNASATCTMCDAVNTVVVKCGEIKQYLSGSLVQHVWPDMSCENRETLIGWLAQHRSPSGFHLCGECWDSQLGDEE